MRITLLPVARLNQGMAPLSASKQGDVLTINGQQYDLSVIPDGATLPDAREATNCEYFTGAIERRDGTLHLTLLMPHSDRPTQTQAFPAPISATKDGPIALPTDAPDLDGKTAQEVYDEYN